MITMKEIGRLAGVSQTAVSFILNGKAEKLSLSDENDPSRSGNCIET